MSLKQKLMDYLFVVGVLWLFLAYNYQNGFELSSDGKTLGGVITAMVTNALYRGFKK